MDPKSSKSTDLTTGSRRDAPRQPTPEDGKPRDEVEGEQPPQGPAKPPQPLPPPGPTDDPGARAEALAERRREAFQSLRGLTATVVEDLPNELDAHKEKNTAPPNWIDLGPFDVDHLVTLSFSVAVPNERIGPGPFKVSVVPREEAGGPRTWILKEVSGSLDGGVGEKPLAELDATDGTLKLRAVESGVYGRPGFLLLRRSVLLVKAADPDRPGAAAEIQREIRLVRPQKGSPPKDVRLVDEPVTITIGCPPVALKSPKTGEAPRLPSGWHALCRVEYGFDRSGTRRPEGRPVVETFTLTGEGGEGAAMSHECPLLDVQPTPGRSFNADPPSSFSLAFEISPAEGVIKVEPAVTGPARDTWSIGDLHELVETSDKEYAVKKEQIVIQIRQRIRSWCMPEVDQFGGQAEKEVADLIRLPCAPWATKFPVPTGPHLEAFLAKDFAPPTRATWDDRLRDIRNGVAPLPRLAPAGGGIVLNRAQQRDDWTRDFKARVDAWAKAYIEEISVALEKERLHRPPISSPATITVEKVWTTAVDEAGVTYEVTLAEPHSDNPLSKKIVPRLD
jgi:hypothetical protein